MSHFSISISIAVYVEWGGRLCNSKHQKFHKLICNRSFILTVNAGSCFFSNLVDWWGKEKERYCSRIMKIVDTVLWGEQLSRTQQCHAFGMQSFYKGTACLCNSRAWNTVSAQQFQKVKFWAYCQVGLHNILRHSAMEVLVFLNEKTLCSHAVHFLFPVVIFFLSYYFLSFCIFGHAVWHAGS